ncbi:phage replisome organizer N-terminal domain-containing protein [Oenococcus oeni]|uniref:phage replisome organizer N-terminal domain-containing protein n=1 Tax=Oenococcus oeni TaxID=1247 RepID=UPI000277BB6E|nr:phage replisome organizer N-terminal domain-containing protein [Oenococcus oeni]EJO04122.1 phage replication initiation [Oenococcus oeni AWRIB548]EJO04169.1 phage replication initiation [Oenococcus oeni AWRIB548]KEP86548.1 replication protein [Oenococcus oeni IOEB_0205]KGH66193.1 replication protein [Oenococcus oeni IOEB_B16]OIL78060.1 replication protein [Oenococcus oeni]
MAEIHWIKLKTTMFDDEKIRLIQSVPESDSILIIWIRLLVLAGKTNDDGLIYIQRNMPYTDEMLATLFNKPLNVVRLAITTLNKFNMIDIGQDGVIAITNWEKHQNIDGMEKVREQNRIRKQRQRKKVQLPFLLESSHVTSRDSHATDTDTDTDTESDTDKNIMSGKPDESLSPNITIAKKALNYFNEQSNRKFNLSAKKNTKPIIARLNEGFSPEDLKTVIDRACSHWKGKSEYEQFLRPETIFNGRFDERLNNTIKWEYKQADVKQKEIAIDYDHLDNNSDHVSNDEALEALKRLKANSS